MNRDFLIKLFIFVMLIVIACDYLRSQQIPQDRITNWSIPGSNPKFIPKNIVQITDFGADTTGVLFSDQALKTAILALNGNGQIDFLSGTYNFEKPIILTDSIILQGQGANDMQSPKVKFKLHSGDDYGIIIQGTETPDSDTMIGIYHQGQQYIILSDSIKFAIGDWIKIKPGDDIEKVNDSWAYESTGQIFEIMNVNGDTLFLNKPLRRSYSTDKLHKVVRILPISQVHINCIQIESKDSSEAQISNIYFKNAVNCSLNGIESEFCNFAHVDVRNSSKITIQHSYFKNGFNYGSGGKAYGVVLESTSGDCYIYNNNFEHLRHSILLQSGANGNVIAYNHSTDPFWTDVSLPSNSAGDIVLHGNYPYMNLFEVNTVQNIVIDNSHGINGPFNTFFRNRAALFGIFMNNNPASNSQNFIGNQVTNVTNPFYGLYYLQGVDHFEFGNQIKGNIIPDSSSEPDLVSLFDYSFGSFYSTISEIPPINSQNWKATNALIEPEYRFYSGKPKAICSETLYENPLNVTLIQDENIKIYPNPLLSQLLNVEIYSDNMYSEFIVMDILGNNLLEGEVKANIFQIDLSSLHQGMYFLSFAGGYRHAISIIKQ